MDITKNKLFLSLVLIVLVFAVHSPNLSGDFIWDDDQYILENTTLRSVEGLYQIWFKFGATPQYYPLVFTSFWFEYHFWQDEAFGYHLTNNLIHIANAILLWLLLLRLGVPGAWWIALIFGIHPVHVESVAWITERKNVLSAFFYLLSFHFYFSYLDEVRWRWYVFSLLCFVGALLSKTITCSLPVILLLVLWWKKGKISFKNVYLTTPFFTIGFVFGLITIFMEKTVVGAKGITWDFTIIERFLIAGRALCFYVYKIFWPKDLIFFYPRWNIDAALIWQYIYPLAILIAVMFLWIKRNSLGRGGLVAFLYFVISLIPAIGFFDVYPMRFSFVADHFQYLASIGIITLFVATLFYILRDKKIVVLRGILTFFVLTLGILTWKQSTTYADLITLYKTTLQKNPDAWIAYNNLGVLSHKKKKYQEALDYYLKALEINPNYEEAHYNSGLIFEMDQNKLGLAEGHFRRAIEIQPRYLSAYHHLAYLYFYKKQFLKSYETFLEALVFFPNDTTSLNGAGVVSKILGDKERAKNFFQKTLLVNPSHPEARRNLAEL